MSNQSGSSAAVVAAMQSERDEAGQLLANLNAAPEEVTATSAAGGSTSNANYSAISAAEMRGDPQAITVGPLTLTVTPLTRRQIRNEMQPLVQRLPSLVQYAAAIRSPRAVIDMEQIAALQTMFLLNAHNESKDPDKGPPPDPVTIQDVGVEAEELADAIDTFEPVFVGLVRLFTPSMNWQEGEAGDAAIADKLLDLTIPDLVLLWRALKASLGGFRGSYTDRTYFRPGGAETTG